ncbi:MAG: mechanosensitive ion channel [candidate division WS1 bacterium]|nr:mechanosensitive ion channel [candidate division WS1 bacterium]
MSFWKALLEQAAEPGSWTAKLAAVLGVVALAAILYLIIFFFERRLKRRMEKIGGLSAPRLRPMVSSISVIASLLRWAVLLLALLYVLISIGINPLPVLTGVGFLGALIAFGSQSLVKDLVTGMFMLLEGQYTEGDYVSLNGVFGRVLSLSFRVTVLETPDGKRQYFPNGGITAVSVYPAPEASFELLVPLTSEEAAESFQPVLESLAQTIQQAFPARVLYTGPVAAWGGSVAPGLRQVVVVRPGYESLVTDDWVGRIRSLLEAQALTPPGGLAPRARPQSVPSDAPVAG